MSCDRNQILIPASSRNSEFLYRPGERNNKVLSVDSAYPIDSKCFIRKFWYSDTIELSDIIVGYYSKPMRNFLLRK